MISTLSLGIGEPDYNVRTLVSSLPSHQLHSMTESTAFVDSATRINIAG